MFFGLEGAHICGKAFCVCNRFSIFLYNKWNLRNWENIHSFCTFNSQGACKDLHYRYYTLFLRDWQTFKAFHIGWVLALAFLLNFFFDLILFLSFSFLHETMNAHSSISMCAFRSSKVHLKKTYWLIIFTIYKL